MAFVVDPRAPRRLPFRAIPGATTGDWTDRVRKTGTVDFAILSPGHGSVGTSESVAEVVTCRYTLRAEMQAGKTGKDLLEDPIRDTYSQWLGVTGGHPISRVWRIQLRNTCVI